MTTVIEWLRAQGDKAVNVVTSPAKNLVRDFSAKAVELENGYKQLFAARQKYTDANKLFPLESLFNEASVQVTREREMRILLLRMMKAAGINPTDYGLSVYGLRKVDVDAAYPGLRYNPADTLGAVPVLILGASVLLTVALLAAAIVATLERIKKVDFVEVQAALYRKEGMTPEAAIEKAKKDVAKAGGKEGMFSNLNDAAKWGALAALAWVGYRAMGKGQ